MSRMNRIRMSCLMLGGGLCLALTGCGSKEETAGNTVDMRDMEHVEGTLNDSMTDLDAVNSDGVGSVENTGSVTRAQSAARADNASSEDTETVASE